MTSEPLTSHAVAAAEIARLRAEVAALREALDTAHKQITGLGLLDPDGRIEAIRLGLAIAFHAAQEQAP